MLKTNKRMLFLCSYAAPYGGNFIPSLIALEEKLGSHGISCVYAFPPDAQVRPWITQMKKEGKDIVFFNFQTSQSEFIMNLETLVEQMRIDYVYTHFCPILPCELFSLLHREIQVFIHIHSDFSAGKESKSLKQKIRNFLVYRVLSRRVHLFSVSPLFVDYNSKRISFVPNGIAKERIACEHLGRNALREKYHINDGDVLCEIFGWIPYVKGVDIAVNAIKKINEQLHLPVKLAVVCGVNVNTEKMRQWISDNTECTGNEAYILYLEPSEDVFSYHEASDILLSASRSEGFSYTILEKLSTGGKCVISDIPGVAWAKEYGGVFTFPSEDVNACVDAIHKLIETGCQPNPQVIHSIQDKYSIDNWTETIVEKINKVVS